MGKLCNYKWPFSIAMLVYQRVYSSFGRTPKCCNEKKVNPMAGEVTTEGDKKRSCRSSHNRAGVLRSWCSCQLGGLKTMIAWVAWMDDTFPSFSLFSNLPYFFCFFIGIILKVNVCQCLSCGISPFLASLFFISRRTPTPISGPS